MGNVGSRLARARIAALSAVKFLSFGVVVAGAALAIARPADAALVVYTDTTSFQTATSHLSTVGFNGIVAPGGFTDYAIPPGYTDHATGTNFTFLNANGSDINVTSATFYTGFTFPADVLDASSAVPIGASESITLPSSSTAFGMYFSTVNASVITVTLSNGDTYTDSSPPSFGNFAFLGFTDPTPFSGLTITAPANAGALLADVKFGVGIPEPSSLALFAISSLLLVGRRRRAAGITWCCIAVLQFQPTKPHRFPVCRHLHAWDHRCAI
jgi:hypothetical protein